MYTLYYSPGACSMAPHVLMNELGVAFDLKRVIVSKGEGQSPEFLKINPRGQVPVLVDDGVVIREGAAILIHLMEEHPSPMLPSIGRERDVALEWLCYANSTLHPAYGRCFFLMRAEIDKAAQETLLKATVAQIDKLWAELDARLAESPYICGKEMTAADILVTVIANWGANFPFQPTLGKNVKRLIGEISQRPSYQKALAAEQVEYKAAA